MRPEKNITVIDTVGAGDAFTSVIILGLLRDWPLQLTLERAQDFASALIGIRGATLQDKAFYRAFTDPWEIAST